MPNANIESFIRKVTAQAEADAEILGVAAAGSTITGETDEYSDLDLVIVTADPLAPDRAKMRAFAARFPGLIAEFTGEHVGEQRLLICLYENPLLHVDFKFLLRQELDQRVENPVVLFERDGILTKSYARRAAAWPVPDLQWIEDRFWVWIHYGAVKIGRGEYFETADFLNLLRTVVLGPLLHMKYGRLPHGVRKLETFVNAEDLALLNKTIVPCNRQDLIAATLAAADLYRDLRKATGTTALRTNTAAESAALDYLNKIRNLP
jgi:predicted nucleotidyltransferase